LSVQQTPPLNTASRIVPVPLHPQRLRERGFNQAQLLAEAVASRTKLPLDKSSLVRTLHTARHRAGLDAEARRETVRGAFTVRSPRLIAGERILLVDDVLTTGATVSACAQALTEAGAIDVFVLTLGRV
jgi:ComF family protein